MSKGRQVAIEGSLQKRSYEDKNGNKRYVTEVVASRVEFVGYKHDGGQAQPAPAQQGSQYGEPISFSDEDLPF